MSFAEQNNGAARTETLYSHREMRDDAAVAGNDDVDANRRQINRPEICRSCHRTKDHSAERNYASD